MKTEKRVVVQLVELTQQEIHVHYVPEIPKEKMVPPLPGPVQASDEEIVVFKLLEAYNQMMPKLLERFVPPSQTPFVVLNEEEYNELGRPTVGDSLVLILEFGEEKEDKK